MLQSIGAKAFSLPTPLYLVGVYDHEGRPNIMTAAWGGVCASNPPCLAVSVRKTRWTHAAILKRQAFTVSVPSQQLASKVDFAGMHSGADTDKFALLGLTPVPAEHVDAPYVGECPIIIELALRQTVEIGSHTQFIGEIMDIKIEQRCLLPNKSPDAAAVDPLLYIPISKEYWTLGEFVALAFSAGHAASRTAVLE